MWQRDVMLGERTIIKKWGVIMCKKVVSVVSLTVFAMAMLMPSGFAQDEGWDFSGGLFTWFAGVDAELQAGSARVDGSADFTDLLESLDGSISGQLVAKNGNFSVIADVLAYKFSENLPAPVLGGNRKTELTMFWFELLLGYKVFETPVFDTMTLSFNPIIGARHYSNRFSIERLEGGELRDRHDDWIDGVVGCITVLGVNDEVDLRLRTDAGGFGISDSSELSYTIGAFVDWHFSQNKTLRLGYLHFGLDKERALSGPLESQFKADIEMSGPLFAIIWDF